MHYIATVGYELEQLDRKGNPKIEKLKYLVEAESVEEVTIVIANFNKGSMMSSECLSIVKAPIECVIDPKNRPEVYS